MQQIVDFIVKTNQKIDQHNLLVQIFIQIGIIFVGQIFLRALGLCTFASMFSYIVIAWRLSYLLYFKDRPKL